MLFFPCCDLNDSLKFSSNAVGAKKKRRQKPAGAQWHQSDFWLSRYPSPWFLSPSRPLSSYQANWRQAFRGGRTMGPTVEWHLRLDGWTGERNIPVSSIRTPPQPTSSPKSLSLSSFLSHGVSFSGLLDIARPLNPEFMKWSSRYLFVVELMCGRAIVPRFGAMLALCWSRRVLG